MKEFEINIGGTAKSMYWLAKNVVTPVVTITSTGDITQTLLPNTFYKFGSIDSLTIILTAPDTCADGTVILPVYAGKFTANVASMPISLPSGITLTDDVISIEAGKTYEFSILDGICLIYDVTYTVNSN